jgi:chemotaxis protein methyltransferase CheR
MGSDLFKFKFNKTQPGATGRPGYNKAADQKKLILENSTFNELRDVIYKKTGIYYSESKKYLLEGRIAKRIEARRMNSFEEYVSLLKSFNAREEMNKLFEAITINETYFFRAEQQFEAFEKIIVPEILKPKVSQTMPVFRVWSAASSSGEEAYTLALLILEKLKPIYPHVQFQIVASDINNAVLDSARKGIYKDYAVRNIPDNYMRKYFTKSGATYIINNEVKKMVKFINLNLFDQTHMRTMINCDVIFCCNVLIYFDLPSKQQVVSSLYDALNRGGYLFIGYSESLHGVTKAFKLIHLPKAMAYKKE